ncbi:MAG: DUF3565 domain-containing protein [Pseudomonadota bacterium]
MKRQITGYHKDDEGDWVAELDCFHNQHVRNQPPFTNRPWVETEEGRQEKLGSELNCVRCDRLEFPDGLVAQRRTPEFNQDSIPAGLQRDHNTKKGVWGVINVVEGELIYNVCEPEEQTFVLSQEKFGIIPPTMLHNVAANGEVKFFVEFYSR